MDNQGNNRSKVFWSRLFIEHMTNDTPKYFIAVGWGEGGVLLDEGAHNKEECDTGERNMEECHGSRRNTVQHGGTGHKGVY